MQSKTVSQNYSKGKGILFVEISSINTIYFVTFIFYMYMLLKYSTNISIIVTDTICLAASSATTRLQGSGYCQLQSPCLC